MGSVVSSHFVNLRSTHFNGVDECAYKDDPSFKANTAGAWSFWFKQDTTLSAAGYKALIGYGVRDVANDCVVSIGVRRIAALGAGNYLSITSRSTSGGVASIVIFYTTAIAANGWYHVVFQSTGATYQCWVNGVSQIFTITSGTNNGDWYGDCTGTDHRLVLGEGFASNAFTAGSYFDGCIDEAVYLDRIFTAGEITALYNNGVPANPWRIFGNSANWKLWLRCGESQDNATTIFDERESNDFTLVNMDASNYTTGTPPIRTNLALWIDFTDDFSLARTGASITQANDKSGNGRNFTQGTAASQPQFVAGAAHGHSAARFDGTADFMALGSSTLWRNIAGGTVYCVHSPDVVVAAPGTFVLVVSTSGGTLSRMAIANGTTANKWASGGRRTDTDGYQAAVSVADMTTGAFVIQAARYDFANTDLRLYIDGTEVGSVNPFQTAGSTDNTHPARIRIGAGPAVAASQLYDGDIAMVMVFHEAHTQAQRDTVMEWLRLYFSGL